MKYLGFFRLCLFSFSCQTRVESFKKKDNKELKKKQKETTSIYDTVNTGFTLHFVKDSGVYNLLISMHRHYDTLRLNIDTDSPPVLFPKVLKFQDGVLYLTRGQAFTYRNIILCKIVDSILTCNQYESNRVDDAPDYFIYQDGFNANKIDIIDRKTWKQKSFLLKNLKTGMLKESKIFKDSIVMTFADGSKVVKRINGIQ